MSTNIFHIHANTMCGVGDLSVSFAFRWYYIYWCIVSMRVCVEAWIGIRCAASARDDEQTYTRYTSVALSNGVSIVYICYIEIEIYWLRCMDWLALHKGEHRNWRIHSPHFPIPVPCVLHISIMFRTFAFEWVRFLLFFLFFQSLFNPDDDCVTNEINI